MLDLLRGARKVLAEQGPAAVVRRTGGYLARRADSLRPSTRRSLREQAERERSFDERHGIQTRRRRMTRRSDVVGGRWLGGYRYEALDPEFDFGAALAVCDLRFEEFVFVDIGAGLGRALFLAAELPFKQLVGVEYSAELVAAARENLAGSASALVARREVTLVHADAIEFELPADPLVLFLFNPFAREVMAEFIERTRASFEAHPRRLVVVYLNPQFGDLWRDAGFVFQVADTSGAWVFDTVTPTDPDGVGERGARGERGGEVTVPGPLLPFGDGPMPGREARTGPRPSSRNTPRR